MNLREELETLYDSFSGADPLDSKNDHVWAEMLRRRSAVIQKYWPSFDSCEFVEDSE